MKRDSRWLVSMQEIAEVCRIVQETVEPDETSSQIADESIGGASETAYQFAELRVEPYCSH